MYTIDKEILQISVDFPLIFRVLIGFSWGVGWASYLQFTKNGQFLVEERTWLTVVVGIGIDLLIAFPYGGGTGNWFDVAIVIAVSSIGIIIRSIYNEQKQAEINGKSYKLIWGLEDAIATSQRAIDQLTKVLDSGQLNQADTSQISKAISTVHKLRQIVMDARRGEYNQKNNPKLSK